MPPNNIISSNIEFGGQYTYFAFALALELERIKYSVTLILRTSDWRVYLSNEVENHQTDSIRRHTRIGRPLGTAEFFHNLEQVTGKPLAPKRPGRKPSKSK